MWPPPDGGGPGRGPARVITPDFKRLSEQYADIVFASVDMDKVAPVAAEYSIGASPTFVFFKNGDRSDDDVIGAYRGKLEDKLRTLAV
ncbi:thioredoxin family protein [Streptomyces sp. NPDC054840]